MVLKALTKPFPGVNFETGRRLERFVCDVISRGAVRFGADLVVHGADILKLNRKAEKG